MSESPRSPDLDRVYALDDAEVGVEDFPAAGWVLNIGGGEGIIGRLKGARVVAVDNARRELEGTPTGPLKVVKIMNSVRAGKDGAGSPIVWR